MLSLLPATAAAATVEETASNHCAHPLVIFAESTCHDGVFVLLFIFFLNPKRTDNHSIKPSKETQCK